MDPYAPTPDRKGLLRKGLLAVLIIVAAGAAYGFYLFNLPHRDVQNTVADASISSNELVNEYLNDAAGANAKYLNEEGESKVLSITGTVASIETDLKGQVVVKLMEPKAKAGVRCSFTMETNAHADHLKPGEKVTIKGVIRAGAAYDADLELFEDAVLEKCSIATND